VATEPPLVDVEPAQPSPRVSESILVRVGLGICVVGGVLAALAPRGDLTAAVDGSRRYTFEDADAAYGIAAAALCALAVVLPRAWARLGGLLIGALLLLFCGAVVVGARTGGIYEPGDEVGLESGGRLLVLAYAVTLVGLVLALIGLVQTARAAPAAAAPTAAAPGTSGKAVAALVLGILGIFFMPAAPLAIALAAMARADIGGSGGTLGGRALSIAGLVLGLIGFVGWSLGFGLAMGFAQP
jgi:Domain of unknown function (DUF4190)